MLASRLDRFQRRHPWAAVPLAVVYKFVDDQGYYLAALLAYYGFLSLFPLLLLLVTSLGFALQGNVELQQAVLHSALREFPVIGQQIGANVHSLEGSGFGLVVGIVVAAYGALGVAGAGQTVLNKVWAVPRVRRPTFVLFYLRSLLLLVTLGVGVLLTTGLTALTTTASIVGAETSPLVRGGATALAVGVNFALFLVAYRVLAAVDVALRGLWPGAAFAAVLWQVFLEAGTYLVSHQLRGASATYGAFGVVLGLLAWLYVGATVAVFGAEINAVRVLRLWPRSLLAPFTGTGPFTSADRRAYTAYAKTEQQVEQEEVLVRFPRTE
ncbi:YihY/virulence factor BrkB family protein [Kutzneria albida]|uniref:Ribonuclease BN n=1 Tax=Kutzneria albida DSM 43870 TaxID=1449976 RepID=W5WGD5_9PSEU|nr:YihY/virulence factor BrkB family protein [Kutzneria albida]AHH97219.1 ribonuclease BN [Kutzneria albida DSM 43870]